MLRWQPVQTVRELTMATTWLAAMGCGELVGVDEYRTVGRDGGVAVENPCGDIEALDVNGECVPVGVRECPEGWGPDDRGACLPALDDAMCTGDTYFLP